MIRIGENGKRIYVTTDLYFAAWLSSKYNLIVKPMFVNRNSKNSGKEFLVFVKELDKNVIDEEQDMYYGKSACIGGTVPVISYKNSLEYINKKIKDLHDFVYIQTKPEVKNGSETK